MKIDTLRSGGQSQGGLDASGGTLTGPLMLSRDPQVPMEAATKRYVDNGTQTLNASNIVSGTLPIARLPAFSGDVTSEAGQNTMNLSNTGVTAGEYGKIVVDAKGRVTNGTGIGNTDIPNISFDKITTGKPTTLAGYGITDAVNVAGGTMTGNLILSGNPVSGEHMVPKQYVDSMTNSLSAAKTGDIVRKAYSTTPAGFLKCNGAEVSKTTYADLYAIIGESNNSYSSLGSGQPWCQQYGFNNSQSVDISNWVTGSALPINVDVSSAIVTKNRVYMIGGYNGSAYVSTVYTAPINNDGTLGAWTTGTSLPGPLGWSRGIVTKNRVYLLGGHNGTAYVSTVYTAPINNDGTLGAWTTGTSLPGPLSDTKVIVTNTRVYAIGGVIGGVTTTSAATDVVYSAVLNSDGTIGQWSTETPLPAIIGYSVLVATKNRIYVLGGWNGTSLQSTVYTAPINEDGTLGTWSIGTSLPGILGSSAAVVTKNRIYLLGGYNASTTVSANIITAPINTDGTLGTWSYSVASLPAGLTLSQAIVTNSRVYLLGGSTDGTYPTNIVYSAPISGGLNDYSAYYSEDTTNYMMPGSGKPWQQQYQINTTQTGDITGWTTGTPLPGVFMGTQAIVTKNRVYLLGGGNGSVVTSIVYTAPINADGTLGTWITTTSLPGVLSNCQLIITKNRVYVLGGLTAAGSPTSVVYTAPINSDGTLGTWTTGTSLPSVLSHSAAIVTKNRVYLIGGHIGVAAVATVYTTPINTDGTLGTWVAGTSMPTALHGCSVAVTKNRIYVIGGASSTTAQSTVYSAMINSDGLIGPWNTEPSLPVNNYNANIYISKNKVYLIGGSPTNSTTVTANVYSSNIKPDGTLSSWVSGTSLPAGFCQASLIFVKNRIYVLGGYNGSSVLSTVYTAIVADGVNDYSPYYDGTIIPVEPIDITTTFKLPDMSATDINGIYHYIKY